MAVAQLCLQVDGLLDGESRIFRTTNNFSLLSAITVNFLAKSWDEAKKKVDNSKCITHTGSSS